MLLGKIKKLEKIKKQPMGDSFMFGNRGAKEQRKRREEEQFQLRKQRTEELLNRKRCSNLKESGCGVDINSIKQNLMSNDLNLIYLGSTNCRKLTSCVEEIPFKSVINSDVVPRLIEVSYKAYYSDTDDANLIDSIRYEVAWIFLNLASGDSEYTKYIVNLDVIKSLVLMMDDENPEIVDHAVWALGNISGDGEELRDCVLRHGTFNILINLITKVFSSQENWELKRNLVWFLKNLNTGNDPSPPFENMVKTLEIMQELAFIDDKSIVSDSFLCISNMSFGNTKIINHITQSNLLKRCYILLESVMSEINKEDGSNCDLVLSKIGIHACFPMIRFLGNYIYDDEELIDKIIKEKFLDFLPGIFISLNDKKINKVRNDICWLLSAISCGSDRQVEFLITSGLYKLLFYAISSCQLPIKSEAIPAIKNILKYCEKSPEYIPGLLENKLISALQSFSDAFKNSPHELCMMLDGLHYALKGGDIFRRKYGTNPVYSDILDAKFEYDIEDLQDSKSNDVGLKASSIVLKYFNGVEVDDYY